MLKARIIPTLLYKDDSLVKGVGFDSWRRVGSAMQSIKVYNLREVDELVFVDITATREGRDPDFATIDDLADECFMPLTVGGGVQTVEQAQRLLRVGADKISVGTAATQNPALISAIAERFGTQCVVVSIDVRCVDGRFEVYSHSGTRRTGIDPVDLAREAQRRGAGEILLTSIDRDGTMQGYDIPLTLAVSSAVSIPVIASGGAGCYEHMLAAIREGGASAVSAAAMFHFTQSTPLEAKRFLAAHGVAMRL
jgi:imidazole glycerol-phosphate synthase subunit HisF